MFKNYIYFGGSEDKKSGTGNGDYVEGEKLWIVLLISVPEQIYTYLGVSYLNSYGSPQTSKVPFTKATHWSNAYSWASHAKVQ